MIITAKELMAMPEFSAMSETVLTGKLKGIEDLVRAYTNNNFQNRRKRIEIPSLNGYLAGICEYFNIGDTVQISESINNGLYVVKNIDTDNRKTVFDAELYDAGHNVVTKIEYPSAVVDGVLNIMLWESDNRDKIGIQSETISRHSVTYADQTDANTLMGYPMVLFGFLKPYMKGRF